jgi:hypothetical protein
MNRGFVSFGLRGDLGVMTANVADGAYHRPDKGEGAKNKDSKQVTHLGKLTAAQELNVIVPASLHAPQSLASAMCERVQTLSGVHSKDNRAGRIRRIPAGSTGL